MRAGRPFAARGRCALVRRIHRAVAYHGIRIKHEGDTGHEFDAMVLTWLIPPGSVVRLGCDGRVVGVGLCAIGVRWACGWGAIRVPANPKINCRADGISPPRHTETRDIARPDGPMAARLAAEFPARDQRKPSDDWRLSGASNSTISLCGKSPATEELHTKHRSTPSTATPGATSPPSPASNSDSASNYGATGIELER